MEYSVNIDEYTTVFASATFNKDHTFSAEYQISAKYQDGLSLAMTTGMETKKNNNNNYTPTLDAVRVTEKEVSPVDKIVKNIEEGFETFGEGVAVIGETFASFAKEDPALFVLLIAAVIILAPGLQPI